MFCPNCKVEYRRGFYECADCHVPLVDALADVQPASSPAASDDLDAPVKLWDGIDPRRFAEIRAALDAKHIPYSDELQEPRLLRTLSFEPLQIWIRKADEEVARTILSDAGADDARDSASSTSEPESGAEFAPEESGKFEVESRAGESADDGQVDDIVEDFDPDEATCEVWAGEDRQMAQVFDDCLRDVGIGCVVTQDDGKVRVLVLPSAEGRAREVVREINEATPPQ